MKHWTRRDLELAELWDMLWDAAPFILALVIIGLVLITIVWGRP